MPARLTALALALLAAAPLRAADEGALTALRDAVAPGECSGEAAATRQPFAGGTLHAVPCRTTAHDQLSVLILERDGALQPLFFANPELRLDLGDGGRFDWETPGYGTVTVSAVVSSFSAEDATGTITIGERIAPGLGEGAFVHTHVLEDWGMTLQSVVASLDGGEEVALWPPAEAGLMQEIGLAHSLDGFAQDPTPEAVLAAPLEVAGILDLGFPSDEEGRPKLEVAMAQEGDRIAVTVLSHGWADDSVAGKAWRALLAREGEGWRVTGLGHANICWRGDTRLTTGLCP